MSAPGHVRIGVMLPTLGTAGSGFPVAAAAQQAEQLGFGSVWAPDHLAFHTGVLEPFLALATAAAVTRRVKLGFGVLLAALRQPAWVAKQVASLQELSERRVLLGVGVGGENPAEWAAAGAPLHGRGRRTDMLLEALPDLLSGRPARLGPPFDLDVPALEPVAGVPPVWIGGRGEAALNRAARRGDGWLGLFLDAAQLARRHARLAALAAQLGRPLPRTGVTLFVNVDDGDPARARRDALGFLRASYRLEESVSSRYVMAGGFEAISEQVAAMVEAGAGQIVLLPAAADYPAQYERLAPLAGALTGR
ncbi:alkanesulfonate monooxygenase SsuD/methylene tetrahydromethanopterin reductase-like flavin-dependent oxidoreductase (luciferase family) [Nonomuraea thailandensis]|uniref:Alkanesulfonate monooxygenase SsuD/methylene tetrahydromethanopterin reductase-like flavin-dependent oxidoreductase (Luciferase family) n=1 Tax=Nonomuraea thailandensis TaxID=1188745 RepID=A0A9X2G6G4_9ACTN|nr:LLM class flavin-dependent oxidoreductase [Nonomuraea thailandensis]MCP2353459.1 alkanesulfonate monooxygenase SsuD/methylene tetrahydromethanopterin reductase-like flavin-dependent oxidoreductase (luciferase family) [Nonomuraea thailandensis]